MKSWLKFAKSMELLRCMMMAILPSLREEWMLERRERTNASLKSERVDPSSVVDDEPGGYEECSELSAKDADVRVCGKERFSRFM